MVPYRILVVDADETWAETFNTLLERDADKLGLSPGQPLATSWAVDQETADRAVLNVPPPGFDLVFLELRYPMRRGAGPPDCHGDTFAAKLRTMQSRATIIVMTASAYEHGLESVVELLRSRRADDVIRKDVPWEFVVARTAAARAHRMLIYATALEAVHDLRTPLLIIRKLVELEVCLPQPSNSLSASLEAIDAQAGRLIDLVTSRVSEAEAGHNALPIGELLGAATTKLAPDAREWITEPHVAAPLYSARVRSNSVLAGGIACLLQNAADCARTHPSKTMVTVKVSSDGPEVLRVLIANDGPVFSQYQVGRFLDPGFSTKGTAGVGLSQGEACIRSVGGTLVLRPRRDGGIDAEVRLPLMPQTAVVSSRTSQLGVSCDPRKREN